MRASAEQLIEWFGEQEGRSAISGASVGTETAIPMATPFLTERDLLGAYSAMRDAGGRVHVVRTESGGFAVVRPHRSRDVPCLSTGSARGDDPIAWNEGDACEECSAEFTMLLRRHHCRGCGRSLCWEHSLATAFSVSEGKDVRVCDRCLDLALRDEMECLCVLRYEALVSDD